MRPNFTSYDLCLYLGWICSLIAWWLSYRIRRRFAKLAEASRWTLGVKTVWCLACAQTFCQHQAAEMCRFFAFVVERLCACLTLLLLKRFAQLYRKLERYT